MYLKRENYTAYIQYHQRLTLTVSRKLKKFNPSRTEFKDVEDRGRCLYIACVTWFLQAEKMLDYEVYKKRQRQDRAERR